MSPPKKHKKSSESQIKPCATGTKKGKSKQLELPLVIEDTILTPSSLNQNELPLFTQESVVTSKKPICKDRLTTSKACTQKLNSLQKSALDSITKEKNLKPFWNELCQEMSNSLWLDIKTDLRDLDLNSLTGYAKSIIADSWWQATQTSLLSGKWLKTYSPLSMSSRVDCTDSANTNLKSRKIRIYPELDLRTVWRKWLAASRYCYNKAIEILRNKYQKKEKLPSAYDLRSLVMTEIPEWVNSTPYNLRGAAVIDAQRAYLKTDIKNKENPTFRSCRKPVQSFKLQSSNWKKNVTYPTHKTENGVKLSELKVNPSEPIPEKINSDFSIILDRGRWFICFSEEYQKETQEKQNIIALDPGIRTFLTGFDGSNFLEIGKGAISKIVELSLRLDRLQSAIAKAIGRNNKRLRFKLRKQSQQIRIKIRNLVDDCHKKTAHFLTSNYSEIIIPKFESQQMVYRAKRKINSKTARNLLTWSHYRFKQTLLFQAEKRGSQVIETTEEYTSKTCSKCGHVHSSLGGAKVFKCPKCGHKIGRDVNGSINIFLKTISTSVEMPGKVAPNYTL